ncbi:hypothetical protein B0J17DRAFT_633569 [Rhizoctonia solani]|nr:hypothetical protein B0J17DRAFT_633569 [Rhizoctonia solani]
MAFKWNTCIIPRYRIYILDLRKAESTLRGPPVYLDKLKQIAKVFEVLSPIYSFAFEYKTNSIGILSLGGTICFFAIDGGHTIWKTTIGTFLPYTISPVEQLTNSCQIHEDLKAINILVSSDHILKPTDFDHSIISERTLQFSQTTRMGGGTLRWMVGSASLL